MKKEIDLYEKRIIHNNLRRKKDDEDNLYDQTLMLGQKVVYNQPLQFFHLFSKKYLTLNKAEMSQEYGCCALNLRDNTDDSVFTIEPTSSHIMPGQVVNYNDYFYIRALNHNTPFYLHVFVKPTDEFTNMKIFELNASQIPSPMRCKLFLSYEEKYKPKKCIQSGDVIKLKQIEADGYLTTSSIQVDGFLPGQPDFLKGQIRRMNRNEGVERPRGGKDKQDLTQ
jgi:hypothetical protein